MKKSTQIIMSISAIVFLMGCGKSEIDKCVDAKIQNYLSEPGKIAGPCLSICNAPPTEKIAEMTESEKDLVGICLSNCTLNAEKRDDVKQFIKTKYEADIRLECLRASSGSR